ncbi:MAG: T9SS type A sorting domain-containing protein [Cytophagaceae bacterium]
MKKLLLILCLAMVAPIAFAQVGPTGWKDDFTGDGNDAQYTGPYGGVYWFGWGDISVSRSGGMLTSTSTNKGNYDGMGVGLGGYTVDLTGNATVSFSITNNRDVAMSAWLALEDIDGQKAEWPRVTITIPANTTQQITQDMSGLGIPAWECAEEPCVFDYTKVVGFTIMPDAETDNDVNFSIDNFVAGVIGDVPAAPATFGYEYTTINVDFTWEEITDATYILQKRRVEIEDEEEVEYWDDVATPAANSYSVHLNDVEEGDRFRVFSIIDGIASVGIYTALEDVPEPQAPAAPEGLALAATTTTITATWTEVAGLTYNLRYSIAGGSWVTADGVSSGHVITDLTPNTAYTIEVQAVEGGLESQWSAQTTSTDTETSAARARMRVTLNIYPNPTTDATRIDYDAINGMDIQISVANMMGNEVARFAGSANGASFDASSLQKGIYIVNILAAGEVIGVERLVVK